MIISWVIVILIQALILYIATHYYRFYHHYFQEPEPFTRWFSRIAEAFPWFWWPLQAVLAAFSALTARFAPWPWAIIGIEGLAFMGWFFWHIKEYVEQHHGDNPPFKISWLWKRP